MTDVLPISVAGANGRMGKQIIQLIAEDTSVCLGGATEADDSPVQGADAGLNAGTKLLSVSITSDLTRPLKKAKGVIIDFSNVESTMENIARAVQFQTPMVIGTTGFSAEQKAQIQKASETIAMVMAPNMSVGVNLMLKLVTQAAKVLHEEYDMEIFEAHHRNKTDAPSGTALRLAEVLCTTTGRDYPKDLVMSRAGNTGARTRREIGMQVLRGGDIVGDHTVFFCGEGERIEIKHVATSRATFAKGAIRAAKWVKDKSPGLYDMQDVLGIGLA